MKRYFIIFFSFLTVAFTVAPMSQAPAPGPRSLPSLVPAGALLYLETRDLASLLHDWNSSRAKQLWLKSDNFEVFSRSRLYLRLREAQQQFAAAAGALPDLSLLESVAGGESAVALFDIGSLEFLYIARMPSAQAMQNALWRRRDQFEPRKAAGFPYFVRTEPSKHRVAAFATTDDYLLLATREDLLAEALELVAGKSGPALKDEKWFNDALRAAGRPGDLRLVLKLDALVRSPHFRSYWLQRNVSDLRQYGAEISDLHRSPTEIREDRVLLRSNQFASTKGQEPGPSSASETALAGVLRLVPDEAGIYRAWSNPTEEGVLRLLEVKVIAPRPSAGVAPRNAPVITLTEGTVGAESDLETRIDVPPLVNTRSEFDSRPLRKIFEDRKVDAALELVSTRGLPGDVFVGTQSAIVLSASIDWDGAAARSAFLDSVGGLWTTSDLGVNWVERRQGSAAYFELDGLAHLAVANSGRYLIVAKGSGLVLSALGRMLNPPSERGGAYAAGFRHARERLPLVKMLSMIETPFAQRLAPAQDPSGHEPLFFSEDLASLSGALAQVESAAILVRDRGPMVEQTVTYRLTQ